MLLGMMMATAQSTRKMMASSAIPSTLTWMMDETEFLTAYAQWYHVFLHGQVTPGYVSWGNETTACFLTVSNVHKLLRYQATQCSPTVIVMHPSFLLLCSHNTYYSIRHHKYINKLVQDICHDRLDGDMSCTNGIRLQFPVILMMGANSTRNM